MRPILRNTLVTPLAISLFGLSFAVSANAVLSSTLDYIIKPSIASPLSDVVSLISKNVQYTC